MAIMDTTSLETYSVSVWQLPIASLLASVFCQDEELLRRPDKPCKILRGNSCSSCRKLEAIEAQLALAKRKCRQAEKEYLALVKQHQSCVAETNRAHDLLVGRLPLEIVSLIFHICAPQMTFDAPPFFEEEYDHPDGTWADIKVLLAIGAVCQSWRQVAWSAPELWCSILVRLDSPNPKRYIEIIQDWLVRSRQRPLLIRLYRDRVEEYSTEFLHLIDVFKQHSSRWEMLDLQHVPAQLVEPFYFAVEELPILRPVQACFHVWNINFKSLVNFQWDILDWVQVDWFTLYECLRLLSSAPRLKHCQFGLFAEDTTESPMPIGIIRHDQVQEFSLISVGGEHMTAFLSRVCFPSLKILVFQDIEDFSIDSIPSALSRSACRLETLAIIDTEFTTETIVSLCIEIPSLTKLELMTDKSPRDATGNHTPEEFLKLLAETSVMRADNEGQASNPNFLPNLRSLNYVVSKKISWDLIPRVFGPLPQLNNPLRRPLEDFYLYYSDPGHDTARPLFNKDLTLDILRLLDSGLYFTMHMNSRPRINVLEAAMEYHGIKSCLRVVGKTWINSLWTKTREGVTNRCHGEGMLHPLVSEPTLNMQSMSCDLFRCFYVSKTSGILVDFERPHPHSDSA
ncbi:hypothetical protein CVT26_008492 [Gymnopilus dilepis]|uniref:Uncharacterized protein n=1 Tax=Gymnopilus dilepis TaxID=231916 RepID=A0A409YRY6_9AGAR|nr:hypothetical protein CVT26_008492 [Gymnopilus dilepis]